jgi:fused signal recognition particle receptor
VKLFKADNSFSILLKNGKKVVFEVLKSNETFISKNVFTHIFRCSTMFGFLKKRIQEAITKVSKKIEKKEEKKEGKKEEKKAEKRIEKPKEIPAKKSKEVSKPEKPERVEKKPAVEEKIEERIDAEIEERIEELKELREEVHEEALPEQKVEEEIREEMEAFEEVKEQEMRKTIKKEEKDVREKKGIIGLIKLVKEKKLSESDVQKILQELQIALLENDVALEVAEKICDDVKKELLGKNVKRGKTEFVIKDALRNAMLDVLKQDKLNLDAMIAKRRPFTIVFFGFNGTGKTSSIAKLAYKYRKFVPVLAAGDTFRAASIEQLEEHGKRIGVKVIKHDYKSDSAAVIYDAKRHAESSGAGLVLADTAGRSHSNANLMDELKKVVRVNKPDMKILVLDSLAGNDIYDQSKLFNDAVGVDAIILTKTDVYEKGGAALSAAYTIKKPILFLSTGQNYDDLKEFNPDEIVDGLLE